MKFALAVALSHDADLLLMDEPTAGLDLAFRRELLDELTAILQDERKSVLFSTHITADLERIADYVTFIRDGSIVFSLPKDELRERWGIVRADRPTVDRLPAAIVKGGASGRTASRRWSPTWPRRARRSAPTPSSTARASTR